MTTASLARLPRVFFSLLSVVAIATLGMTASFSAQAQSGSPTPLDEEYLPLLRPGVFTICKVAPASAAEFPFEVSINGGDPSEVVLQDSSLPLDLAECVDVHEDVDLSPDQVSITELVPDGYEVSRVSIWNLDRFGGTDVVSFNEYPAGTETISGAIEGDKLGCIGIFYNDMDQGACWMTGGGVKFERLVGDDLATCSDGKGPVDTVGGVVFPGCSPDASEGGQWNHVAHSDKLHVKGNSVQVVSCGNVPGIEPGSESPVTPFNYIEFEGVGTVSGIHGNKIGVIPVTFFGRVEDRNEPGNEQSAKSGEDIDRYFLRVVDGDGNLVYLVDEDGDENTVDPLTITGGNFQIHTSSCDE